MNERINYIKQVCVNKNVLDLGCIDHNALAYEGDKWLHAHIKQVSKSVVGVDYAIDEVITLNNMGFDIRYGDVETFKLNKKFDVVVAGELIEHLFNLGTFLDNVKLHLKKNGIFVLTTPNAFAIRRSIGTLVKGSLNENKEHTCYFSDTTIKQLLQRKGFKDIKIKYMFSEDDNKLRYSFEKILGLMFNKYTKCVLYVECKKC